MSSNKTFKVLVEKLVLRGEASALAVECGEIDVSYDKRFVGIDVFFCHSMQFSFSAFTFYCMYN